LASLSRVSKQAAQAAYPNHPQQHQARHHGANQVAIHGSIHQYSGTIIA
jgi:hypothetical protein